MREELAQKYANVIEYFEKEVDTKSFVESLNELLFRYIDFIVNDGNFSGRDVALGIWYLHEILENVRKVK